jgi:Gas vesicle protein G
MGLLSSLLTLPFAPVRGVTAIARLLVHNGEEQLYGQASIRRELEELDEAVAAGRISAQDRAQAEQAILDRLTAQLRPVALPAPPSNG